MLREKFALNVLKYFLFVSFSSLALKHDKCLVIFVLTLLGKRIHGKLVLFASYADALFHLSAHIFHRCQMATLTQW